jgi:translation initiation factor 4G
MPDFTIRPARESDSPFLGWVIFTAARGHLDRGWFDVVLQREESFCLEFCSGLVAARARSWWHWSLFTVVEIDGTPAAALCGFGDESVYGGSSAAMTEAATAMGVSESEQAQYWPRGKFILSCTTGEDGAWTIENVATLPAYRGQGLVRALLNNEFSRAHAEGYARAQISFLIGNERAERAYARAGFVFAEDATSPEFEAAMGVPGLRRLVRDI